MTKKLETGKKRARGGGQRIVIAGRRKPRARGGLRERGEGGDGVRAGDAGGGRTAKRQGVA